MKNTQKGVSTPVLIASIVIIILIIAGAVYIFAGMKRARTFYAVQSSCPNAKYVDDKKNTYLFETGTPGDGSIDTGTGAQISIKPQTAISTSTDLKITVSVISPAGKESYASTVSLGGKLATLQYPKDFIGGTKDTTFAQGQYRVNYFIKGQYIACNAFGVK